MFRNIVVPVQAWLLTQKQCVDCGQPLNKGGKEKLKNGNTKIICQCGHIYTYDQKKKKYQRNQLTKE